MYTTYQLNSDELTYEFIDILKSNFKNRMIEISVCDFDETAYLMSSPENHEILMRRIDDVRNNRKIITPNQDTFQ